ncbi:MAG: hypothetical protein ACPGWM_11420, partial [Flavobacteriales bacterium]
MLFPSRKVKRRRITLLLVLGLIVLVFCFRDNLLRGAGNVLIAEDQLKKSEAIAVLGGNSFDRALHASQLYHEGWAQELICTGGNSPLVLEAVGVSMFEAEVSEKV